MSKTKRFLLILGAVYVLGAVLGLLVFRSPSYSKKYLAEYGTEHRRYLETIESPAYKGYKERPNLHPLTEELAAEGKFVKAYESNPAFIHEKRRMFWYNLYFKTLNSAVFIALLVRFLRKPVADFLDAQIAEVKRGLNSRSRNARTLPS